MSQNIWILTIGSSDVQLKTKSNWTKLFRAARSQLDDRGFTPVDGIEGRFQVPARVMGVVYSQPQAAQNFDDLVFPLIDNFISISEIKDQPINKIILVLGDQSIFKPAERSSQNHAYWQDTCTLQPLLEKYLNQKLKNSSPDLQFQSLFLKPTSTAEGLDDWNSVLKLVQNEFSCLEFPGDSTIYVSHQAGTPAISSAIQFTSLSRFGKRVEFLVSNERDTNLTKILPSSSYLKGIRKKEVEALLRTYNYAGIEALLKDELECNGEVKALLNAAKKWNVAKFSDFLNCLEHHPKFASEVADRKSEKNWWWIGYEEAYLAVIRENQDNIVEAFFHSFRAFEYIFSEWGCQKLNDHIEKGEGDSISFFKKTILEDPRFLELTGDRKKAVSGIQSKFKKIEEKRARGEKIKSEDKAEFGFFNLCSLFKAFNYADYKGNCSCLNVFFGEDNVRDRRNAIVHQVKGLSVVDLCTYWGISCSEDLEDIAKCEKSIMEWKAKLKDLLNCVVKEDFHEGFATLEEASLMSKVHQALEIAIAHL